MSGAELKEKIILGSNIFQYIMIGLFVLLLILLIREIRRDSKRKKANVICYIILMVIVFLGWIAASALINIQMHPGIG